LLLVFCQSTSIAFLFCIMQLSESNSNCYGTTPGASQQEGFSSRCGEVRPGPKFATTAIAVGDIFPGWIKWSFDGTVTGIQWGKQKAWLILDLVTWGLRSKTEFKYLLCSCHLWFEVLGPISSDTKASLFLFSFKRKFQLSCLSQIERTSSSLGQGCHVRGEACSSFSAGHRAIPNGHSFWLS
jgi:hypothetical protein